VTVEVTEAYLKKKTDGLSEVQRMEILTIFAGELNKKSKIYKIINGKIKPIATGNELQIICDI